MLNKLLQISAASLLILPTLSLSSNLDLSKVPLFLDGNVEPNIMFTLDDSGSMHWEYMPDDNWTYFLFPRAANVYGSSNYGNYLPVFADISYSVRARSSGVNQIYYNPATRYIPWSNEVGASMGNVSITCAPHNPADTAKGCRDLTANNTATANWETYNGNGSDFPTAITTESGVSKTFWPAVYYNYNGGDTWNTASFTKVEIRPTTTTYTTASSRTDCAAAPTCTYAEEIQNFANWYSYYRSRILLARGGVGRAFAKQGTQMRVGFAAINQSSSTIDGVSSGGTLIQGVRPFSGTGRSSFFNNLYGHSIPTSGTPLRRALANVGNYFKRSDNAGPWGNTPGSNDTSSHLYCRQNYNILMTDGYWNGSVTAIGNADNTAGATITGPNNATFTYTPSAPYSDSHSDTLADFGMEFWKQDLRPNLINDVPTNPFDEAFWQHLVNFTVGLGVNGTLDSTQALFDNDGNGNTIAWPNPTNNPAKIDDLWHAAVNSRGAFFSASDPDTFATSLSDILSSITERTSAASAAALNSGTVSSTSQVYLAQFNTRDWSGQLLAYRINSDGSLDTQLWNAANKIPAADDRVILTHDGSTGQAFRWGDISSTQQSQLGSENLLNYLRGDQSNEVSVVGTSGFRNRNSRLGDIVHSSPNYIAAPGLNYPNNLGSNAADKSYAKFRADNTNRQPMIYVSSNDGLLHGFKAPECPNNNCPSDAGREVFAYVPSALMSKLPKLAETTYTHDYFADGSPIVIDAFFNDNWHTVLVSGLRGGGQGVFALDITNPNNFSTESTAKSKVLWEFTDDNDRDLGFTYGTPSIAKLQNGSWAAIFSGGYNNTYDDDNDGSNAKDSVSGDAVLYIVDIRTGNIIKKFDTQTGSAEDPTGNGRPNGLASPSVVDFNGDSVADAIYVGDLFGNIWKMDISGAVSNWGFSYNTGGSSAKPAPIFTACATPTTDATCNASRQPITSQVQVDLHPSEPGYLVYFGTGQYFEVGDASASGQTTQSFYAIWDKTTISRPTYTRSSLLTQTIEYQVSYNNSNYRITSTNSIDWSTHNGWHIDFINPNTNGNEGERQVIDATLRDGRVLFTTVVPSSDDCKGGGGSWFMVLNQENGARYEYSIFDIDNNRSFDDKDLVPIDLDGDGKPDEYLSNNGSYTDGVSGGPALADSQNGTLKLDNTSDGYKSELVKSEPGLIGRQSWRQLDFN